VGRSAASQNILDVGWLGGSSLYLAEKFNATGILLAQSKLLATGTRPGAAEYKNSVQSSRCSEYAFADALDLVWSLESGEHMPDKVKFLQECYGC